MAVYSMTGYASASATPASEGSVGASVTVEIRSVNSRFLDLSFRIPEELRHAEPALRELLTAGLRRGKVELKLNVARPPSSELHSVSTAQLKALAALESEVRAELPQATCFSVHEALQWCRGRAETPPDNSAGTPALLEATHQAARSALDGLHEARAREGERLVAILMQRLVKLRALAQAAEPMVPRVVARLQARFLERWSEALAAAGADSASEAAARERALNEATAFAIRIDVAEELSRLSAHLDELERLFNAGGELGKRLDFLIQELHREANTLGSKSTALELTGVSLDMKVLIEQMREQVQNIE
jgi:uncharacterized protein (TIGR00255 family)